MFLQPCGGGVSLEIELAGLGISDCHERSIRYFRITSRYLIISNYGCENRQLKVFSPSVLEGGGYSKSVGESLAERHCGSFRIVQNQ